MGRQHMHFATGIPDYHNKAATPKSKYNTATPGSSNEGTAKDQLEVVGDEGTEKSTLKAVVDAEPVISGMRKSASIMIWVDLVQSAEQGGLKWWKSDNGVILTEGDEDGMVKMKWVKKVEQRSTGQILWEKEDAGLSKQADD